MTTPFTPRRPRAFVGTYRPRIDAHEKAGGQAEFLDDVTSSGRFPGMLHAKILRSPLPHARIARLDTTRAASLPGVHDVLTYADPDVAGLKPTTSAWTSANTASYDKMYFPSLRDRKVLADTATWVGDKFGVAVAAETEAQAADALRSLDIEWDVRPFVLDPLAALADDAPAIHPEINPDGNVLPCDPIGGGQCYVDKGDVDAAWADCAAVVEVGSRYHRANHSVLDTRGCLAYWKNGQLVFYTNYYQADQTRMYLAQMLDLPLTKVRVINPYAGAQFGRCNVGEQPFFVTVALLAKRTGRPVKYKMSLEEDFHDTRNSVGYVLQVGADDSGRLHAAHFRAVGNAGGYSDHTMAAIKVVLKWDALELLLAHIPNLRMESWAVYTNSIPGGCMRGIGNIQLNLALGLAIDAVAERLDLDPIDVALANLGHEWETLPSASLEAVLREGAAAIGWEHRHAPGAGPWVDDRPGDARRSAVPDAGTPDETGAGEVGWPAPAAGRTTGTVKRGLGFSCHNSWHAAWQERVRGDVQLTVKLNPDLTVILQAPMVETGTGSNSCAVFACAESLAFLGVRPEDVQWIQRADTETGLKDMVQTDSSVSFLHAELMTEAAELIADKLREMAALELEVAADALTVADGQVYVTADPARGSSVRDLLWNDTMVPITVTVSRTMPGDVTGAPFAATFAEVDVDTATGQVTIGRLVVVHDAGTVMHASGAEAQQVGGQCTGVGESLLEEIVYDRATGIPLNFNFIDYGFPTMMDFPAVEPLLLEVWQGGGEYGACGIGEGAPTSTQRAIVNAVYNAVGVRIDDIPVTPTKVLEALAMQAGATADPTGAPIAGSGGSQRLPALRRPPDRGPQGRGRGRLVHRQRLRHDAGRRGWASGRRRAAPRRRAAGRGCVVTQMSDFAHVDAHSLEEAGALAAADPMGVRVLAGGTDLLGTLKDHVHAHYPKTVVNIKTISGLDRLTEDDAGLRIGALVPIERLEHDPVVRERYPLLAEAARAVAAPQLRTMGTVGGNLCQEPRCWYYRTPENAFPCLRKGGTRCPAFTGESRYHSIYGSIAVTTRPCTAACPGSVRIPEYMEQLRAGDTAGAARMLLAANPMPAITGRVCPHACEGDCNRGRVRQPGLGARRGTPPGRLGARSGLGGLWRRRTCDGQTGRRGRLGAGGTLSRLLRPAERTRGHRVRALRGSGRHAALGHPRLPTPGRGRAHGWSRRTRTTASSSSPASRSGSTARWTNCEPSSTRCSSGPAPGDGPDWTSPAPTSSGGGWTSSPPRAPATRPPWAAGSW